jgi:hypothetical protein
MTRWEDRIAAKFAIGIIVALALTVVLHLWGGR